MFKFVVLCAFVAASVAEPEPQLLYPGVVPSYTSYSTVVSPAATSISSQASSVIHPSAITYNTPFGFPHFIKKRSPQFLTPAFNAAYNYYPTASYISTAPVVQSPITYTSAALPLATPVAAHLIKKRSADPQFIPASYYPTTYVSNPAITTPVVSTPFIQSPYYPSGAFPLVNAHLIKKRSAQFLPTYPFPSTYINTIPTAPYVPTPVVSSTIYSTPTATIPLTHLIKKRSADPQLLTVPAPTYYSGSPFYPTYTPTTTLIKSAPIISANPFVYSTYIKK